jgi:DNA primase large subunit
VVQPLVITNLIPSCFQNGCSPDLREKFIRTESELFRQRYETDDQNERREFLESLQFDWQIVSTVAIQIIMSSLLMVFVRGHGDRSPMPRNPS